jgi:hypothetical protein
VRGPWSWGVSPARGQDENRELKNRECTRMNTNG